MTAPAETPREPNVMPVGGPQHSPMPWRAMRTGFTYDVTSPDGSVVALVYSPADPDLTATGNADLITAAPDLLASCEEMREILLRVAPFLRGPDALATTRAWSAIAKARGTQ